MTTSNVKRNVNEHRRLPWGRLSHVVFEWGRAFWPVVVVVTAGATVFRNAVIESIASTPHPALVYAIFAVAICAVLLCAAALLRYVREQALMQRLLQAPQGERAALIANVRWQPDMLPVLRIMTDEASFRPEVKTTAVEHELFACEEHLFAHLVLPNYLTGALVGLGLVGTFIGLLGTLADLGDLFSSLMNAGGASSADPVAMFTDMLRKLQEPMRGMGTAFVASLYGLLGSLVLGLVTYSVRKSGTKVVAGVRALIRESDRREGERPVPTGSTLALLQFLVEELRTERNTVAKAIEGMAARQDRQVQCLESMMAAVGALRTGIVSQGERNHAQLQQVALKLDILGRRTWPSLGQAVAQGAAIGTAISAAAILMVLVSLVAYRRLEAAPEVPVAAITEHETQTAPQTAPVIVAPPEVAAAETDSASSAPAATVTVRPGDYLRKIARRYHVTTDEILRANPALKNADVLQPGQVLQLPSETNRQ